MYNPCIIVQPFAAKLYYYRVVAYYTEETLNGSATI
jgi:hypothetical protein